MTPSTIKRERLSLQAERERAAPLRPGDEASFQGGQPPAGQVESERSKQDSARPAARLGGGSWKKVTLALAAVGFGYFTFFAGGAPEKDGPGAPNWQRHVATPDSMILLGAKDRDRDMTDRAREAIGQGGNIPETAALSPGMRRELATGDAAFYHIYLYDSCAQDGDIVAVRINGQLFAQIAITHAGATISVPLSSKTPNTIDLVGVYDGGFGITVACQTSQGEFFSRVLRVGEVQRLGIALK